MGLKRTPALVSKAKQLRAAGRSFAEIAEELSKGGKSISKASVMGWLRDSAPLPAASSAPSPVAPVAPPTPLDESLADPDYVPRTLVGLLRRERDREARLTAAGDESGAQRAGRYAKDLALAIAKLQAKDEEEGDTVRVSLEDVRAAGDRALVGLGQVADRVIAERSGWPRCGSCGQPCGGFTDGDKSPLRAMFERVATGSP